MPRYKTRDKVQAEKATLDHAFKYAIYFLDRFYVIPNHKGPIYFPATSPYQESVLKYLKRRADYNHLNRLIGIVAVLDFWYSGKYSTGGRIHLYMGGTGNLFEALDSDVVIVDPVEYEEKDLILRKIFSRLSPSVPPNAGNVHLHPHLCNLEKVDVQTIRRELTQDHGLQNAIGVDAPLQYFLLTVKNGQAKWDRKTTDKDLQRVFSSAV